MALDLKFSSDARDDMLDAINAIINAGGAGSLKIFSGTVPTNCAAADANGTPLATVTLPQPPFQTASGGVMQKSASAWSDTADNDGTATHFRIYDNGGTCQVQGTVGTSTSDMIVDNDSFNTGQTFTVTQFDITAGNS